MKYKENIIKWNLEKYNYTKELYNKYQIQLFMQNANTHLISTFKDYLFYDDFTEFFSKFYILRESLGILIPLLKYYERSSYIFPNYTILNEGKYIYKNIIKKQILINYLEELEIKKRNNKFNSNANKNKTKNNSEIIFNTQLYNNILMNNNNDSNLNILFGIKINKNKDNNNNVNNCNEISKDKDDSINTFKKIINAINESSTKSVGTNTINIIAYNKKKIKNGKKRNNNISLKGINNSTNFTSNISSTNTNFNSMFKINKKINHNINNIINISKGTIYHGRRPCITLEKNINNNSDSNNNSNLNFYAYKKLHKNKAYKNNSKKKTNSFLTYFNSSFMKSFLTKLNEKKCTTSDKSVINMMKTKNKIIKNKKHVLTPITPIEKIKHHISISSFFFRNSKITKYLTNIPSAEKSSKNNLKYKKIKVKNINNNRILINHTNLKSKICENKNKGVLIKDNHLNHHHQRNRIFKLNTYSISLNNSSIYKTINLNNMKKSIITLTQYRKDKKISLCNEMFRNENSIIAKKKYFTNNISKTKLTTNINNTEEEKKKTKKKKVNKIYFKTKLPSPLKLKRNILNKHFNTLNKNNSLFKDFKTLHNLKYFPKKNISEFCKK